MHLEEVPVVHDQAHRVAHVVRFVRVVRHDLVELPVHALGIIRRRHARGRLQVVLGKEADQVAAVLEAFVLVLGGEMGHAGLGVVRHGAPELLETHLLAGHRLDHVGPRDEHVRGLLDHEDEVGHGRGVDRAARARAHDQADLGDHARALDVADEDVAIGPERHHALLDPRAAGVVDPDHGAADPGRQVHDLAHLLGHHLAERAAEDREVLGEDRDRAPFDQPVAGDDRVAPGPVLLHVELVRPVAHEGVYLLERARVEQLLDPLPGGELPLRVLLLDRLLRGRVDGGLAQLLELGELLLVGLWGLLAHGARDSTERRSASGRSVAREGLLVRLPELVQQRLEAALHLGGPWWRGLHASHPLPEPDVCHLLLDLGAIMVADDLSLIGTAGKLRTATKHQINIDYIRYHRSRYAPESSP